MEQKLLDLGKKAIQKAEFLGATQAEAYIASTRSFLIDVKNSAITSATENRDAGCGIRSIVDKKIGFAYVTSIVEEDVLEAATKSVDLAKASVPDPSFVSLPSYSGTYSNIKGLVDSNIVNLTSEEAANLIIRTTDATKNTITKFKVAVEAQLKIDITMKSIINTLDISSFEKDTRILIFSYPSVKDGDKQTSSFEFQISRNLGEVDPEWIGRRAGEKAIQNFNPKLVENGEMPILLTPNAVGTIIGYGFGQAINAEEIQFGRSYISDAIGDMIASEKLTIIDDALRPKGVYSRIFDSEGVKSQRTETIKAGVLKSILHNSYTANKGEVENTGNASRPSYSDIPTITPSNLVITPNKGSQEDLISEIKKGILLRDTGDRPNMITGDLSAMVMEGFFIQNGEIKHPVKNTLIGTNMLDLLKKVEIIGDDVRTTGRVVTPSLIIDSVKITSG